MSDFDQYRQRGIGVNDSIPMPGGFTKAEMAAYLESIPKAQVTLFCPVCCSPDEREARDGSQIDITCNQCGQVFRLGIDLKRIEENS